MLIGGTVERVVSFPGNESLGTGLEGKGSYPHLHFCSYTTSRNDDNSSEYFTPGRGKIVPRNVTLLVGEKLFHVMLHCW